MKNTESQAIIESSGEKTPLVPQTEKQKKVQSNLYVEPGLFLLFFAYNFSGTVIVNQILVQTCHVSYEFNETDCLQIGTHNESDNVKHIDDTIQPFAANILMVGSLIGSMISISLALIIGPFSDRFGRKPIINHYCVCTSLHYGTLCILSYLARFYKVSPWFFGLASTFHAIGGGYSGILISTMSYTADSSSKSNRGIRMTLLDVSILSGNICGSYLNSCLVNHMNSLQIFFVSLVSILLASIYLTFFVRETVSVNEADKKGGFIKIFRVFSLNYVIELIYTSTKQRKGHNRKILWLLISILMIFLFTLVGQMIIVYLFERKVFDWTIKETNLYDSVTTALTVLGSLLGLCILKKLLHLSEITIIIIALTSKIIGMFFVAFATQGWSMYVASVFGMLEGLVTSMSRSILSQIVDKSEIGKLFSLSHLFEDLGIFFASPVYATIYTATFRYFPGAFALLSVSALSLGLFSAIAVLFFLTTTKSQMKILI